MFFLRAKNDVVVVPSPAFPRPVIKLENASVLFVCMGNICRSPTAAAVMRRLIEDAGLQDVVTVDSAGTHDYHVGAAPDPFAQAAARRRGYDLGTPRARQVTTADFREFDLVLGMDSNNLAALESMCPAQHRPKLGFLMSFARRSRSPYVPDPYGRGAAEFDRVLDYVEDACGGLMEALSNSVSGGALKLSHSA